MSRAGFGKLVAAFAAVLLLLASPAWAHKLNLKVEKTGETVSLRTWYPGEDPGKNLRVKVTDPDGKVLIEDKTDSDGQFTFTYPEGAKSVTVEVRDMLGHLAKTTVFKYGVPE
jgi:nickel transport protein